MQVNIFEAKSQLSKLIAAAEAGEEVLIARNGQPVVKLSAYSPPKVRAPGAWAGKAKYNPEWNSPETNKAIEADFYGSD